MPRYAISRRSEVEGKNKSTSGLFINPESGQKPPNGARAKAHFQDQTVCAIDLGPQTPGEHDTNTTWTSWKSLKEIDGSQLNGLTRREH